MVERRRHKRISRSHSRSSTRITDYMAFVTGIASAFDIPFNIPACVKSFTDAKDKISDIVHTVVGDDSSVVVGQIVDKYKELKAILEAARSSGASQFMKCTWYGVKGVFTFSWLGSGKDSDFRKASIYKEYNEFIEAKQTSIDSLVSTMESTRNASTDQMNRWLESYKSMVTDSFNGLTYRVGLLKDASAEVNDDLAAAMTVLGKLMTINDTNLNKLEDLSAPTSTECNMGDYKISKVSDKVGAIKAIINKIRAAFSSVGAVVKQCFGQDPSQILLKTGAEAIISNVALTIPGLNFFALAWRIAKTIYFVGKSIYNLINSIGAEKDRMMGAALGYGIKAIVYLFTGMLGKRKAYMRMLRRNYKKLKRQRKHRRHRRHH